MDTLNPFAAEVTFVQCTKSKTLRKSSKSCHLGIHWKALAEYSQTSTYLPWFQRFLSISCWTNYKKSKRVKTGVLLKLCLFTACTRLSTEPHRFQKHECVFTRTFKTFWKCLINSSRVDKQFCHLHGNCVLYYTKPNEQLAMLFFHFIFSNLIPISRGFFFF